jgi:hypothetical protein
VYIIKVKGKAKIPDYIQLRDDSFTLLAYCRCDRPEKELEKLNLSTPINEIKQYIDALEFGKVVPFTFT